MESLKELLITGIIALVYFVLIGKKKKQTPPKPISKPVFQELNENSTSEMEEEESIEQNEKKTSMEDFSTKFPKNEQYFTYETISRTENESLETSDSLFTKPKQNLMQNTENEEKKNIELTFSQDELIKGVIYSEILKNPYN